MKTSLLSRWYYRDPRGNRPAESGFTSGFGSILSLYSEHRPPAFGSFIGSSVESALNRDLEMIGQDFHVTMGRYPPKRPW
ncbi:MAG: hypothetical protein GY953_15180 [bacterium]|nr:hypothetical protein [bacterium]